MVDEEQRFGVTHKEKIKQYKNSVDVLTLTATPIPRTMHMSLIGIRDMSVLEERRWTVCPSRPMSWSTAGKWSVRPFPENCSGAARSIMSITGWTIERQRRNSEQWFRTRKLPMRTDR